MNAWLPFIGTIAVNAIAVAIMLGKYSERQQTHGREIKELKATATEHNSRLLDHENRLSYIEGAERVTR